VKLGRSHSEEEIECIWQTTDSTIRHKRDVRNKKLNCVKKSLRAS